MVKVLFFAWVRERVGKSGEDIELPPNVGTVGQLLTNRALYDQLNGTLGRANAMLARFQNPNGGVGRMLQMARSNLRNVPRP